MNAQNKETQAQITPDKAIEMLKEGNQRFLNKQPVNRDYLKQIEQTTAGQWPFAVVLSCIDSRVPAEVVFDQGIGDIFSARVAGNCVNEDLLGSIEYGVNVAGSKLIVVLGHTQCGAIKGAIDAKVVNELGMSNLNHLLTNFESTVQNCLGDKERTSSDADLVKDVVYKNVENVIENIKQKSESLAKRVNEGSIKIVGAIYHVEDGKVTFL